MNIVLPPISIIKQILQLQKRKSDTTYRLMHFVVQQEVKEGLLLYNMMTCCMVMITQEEAKHIVEVEGLIENWFCVPENHDDKKLCKNLNAAAKLVIPSPKGIRKYTIVTTTGCNARCSYCFEKGIKPVSMSMETAEKVAHFIISHKGEYDKVQLAWFGGEPLCNFKVIDHICSRLKEHDVKFVSTMTSNSYLFNKKMVGKACSMWKLKRVQITLDGTEENYNHIKAYITSDMQSPFLRVMDNISMMLHAGIIIPIRMHVNNENVHDMRRLLSLIASRFKDVKGLSFQIRHLFELFGPEARILSSEERVTLLNKISNLEDYLIELELAKPQGINQYIKLYQCMVDSKDAVMIAPDGHLGLCEHHLNNQFFGHIDSDDWDLEVIKQSREYCEEIPECDTCALYPKCFRLKCCNIYNICFKEEREDRIAKIRKHMLNEYRMSLDNSCGDFDE